MTLQLNWTDEELYSQISQVLANITGMDPTKGEIRLAYSEQGQPSWRHKDNVIAYYLTPSRDVYNEDITEGYLYNEEEDKFDKTEVFTQVMDCKISCYGPLSRNLSTLIRVGIQSDENRLNLSKYNIYPVPKTPPAMFVPYEYNKQWWLRSDLTITFNIFTKITSQVDRLVGAGITILTDTGDAYHGDITS